MPAQALALTPPRMLIGYNTNGFAHHALDEALAILAELGYRAVALTPDVHHLPPFATTSAELRSLRRRLDDLGLVPVVETGARFVLDPRRKHRPTLLERDATDRKVRLNFLMRCVSIAAEIGAGVVSIWSGRKPAEVADDDADSFLRDGVHALCEAAAGVGVRVGFEPEPGMWVETLAHWERLRAAVGHSALGLTLDVGHVPCTELLTPGEALRAHLDEIVNVHLDDVRGGVHEHLQLGEGELEWGSIVGALDGWRGVASVELSRHAHEAPAAAASALTFLRSHGAT